MAGTSPHARGFDRLASLPMILEWALGVRILSALAVEWFARSRGLLCVFPDTLGYWLLAGTIRDGAAYEVVEWGDIPHFALRTPGYPLFLAACRGLFGDRTLPVRLIQAVLGMVSVWLVARLAGQFASEDPSPQSRRWSAPLAAAALAAFEPYLVVTSALVLSEAVFIPLMLVALWGLAILWPRAASAPLSAGRAAIWALGTGAASGAAVLVRPSWALFVPLMLLAWIAASPRGRRIRAARYTTLVVLGVVIVMAPWWVRNARVFGRFVPTAIWMGASLYDGLNPIATGASDMDFLAAPDVWPLDEETQDAVLRARAVAFAREHPWQVLRLAVVKFARFWSPWPNAGSFRSPLVNLASAVVTLPLFVLIALGLWECRRDPRALAILAGPLSYFCALHVVFASSMRYRIPAIVPAMALAAIGLMRIARRERIADRREIKSRTMADGF
jgi:4-amino-4-deoxy-L-arabinose transferase-like glycosyltransferase